MLYNVTILIYLRTCYVKVCGIVYNLLIPNVYKITTISSIYLLLKLITLVTLIVFLYKFNNIYVRIYVLLRINDNMVLLFLQIVL